MQRFDEKSGYYWCPMKNFRTTPANAVLGGHDSDGDQIYVGKAQFRSMRIPAKIVPNKGKVYVAFDGHEHEVHDADILCRRDFRWIPSRNGHIPAGAVEGGWENGAKMFIGRTHYNGSLTVGRVHSAHRCLYISWGGREHKHSDFEVLVYE